MNNNGSFSPPSTEWIDGEVHKHVHMICQWPPLQHEELVELFKKLHLSPSDLTLMDREVFDTIVRHNLRLVVGDARPYHWWSQRQGTGLSFLDLVDEGVFGLMKAVERFEWERGFRFPTYAGHWIKRFMSRAVDTKSRLIRIPVHLRVKRDKILRFAGEFSDKHGRWPETDEIAQELDMPIATVKRALSATRCVVSLFEPVSWSEGPDRDEWKDVIDDHIHMEAEREADLPLLAERVEAILPLLEDVEQLVLRLRCGLYDNGEVWTLERTGKLIGVTRERIRQIERDALQKLRRPKMLQVLLGREGASMFTVNGSGSVAKAKVA